MNIIIPTNEFQTPVTDELLQKYPEEVQEQFMDFMENVEFLKWLASPDRPRAKDLPRDSSGKIIVNLEKPHILEDMDYFRQPALHFLEHKCYTFLKPNSNPNSEYRKFWDSEWDKILNGCVRPSDGEWITGMCYWFLNYNPMMINKQVGKSKMAVRVEEFPLSWEGIYWRFHYLDQARKSGRNGIELAKRGVAKSYGLSSIMTHNLIMGENEQVRKRNITVLAAASKEYLKEDRDGTLSKFVPSLSFIFNNTPFPHLLRKKSPNEMSWVMGYDDVNGIPQGSGNTVLAVSTKDDSDKLRGKRGWILIEEMGNYPNLLPLYDSVRRSTMEGDVSFAMIYLVGTANNEEADFTAAKTLLYSPDGYNILSLKNVYDKKNQGKQRFGFFFPAYVNRFGCYNKDGVSDVVKALLQILMDRYDKKYSADPQSVLRVIAEDPITPAEAIIKVKANYFPVAALTERAMQLDADPHAYDGSYTGNLVLGEDGIVKFNMTGETPLRSWEVKGDSKGCIEIFQMPEKNPQGEVFPNRYILGHDPVDNDEAESSSLSSTFVLDLFTDRIVAEYTGRHKYAEENYEVVRLLCMFYNGKCLYESNKKGLYAYFTKINSLKYLAQTPEYLRDREYIKYSAFGSNAFGVNASKPINDYANNLIREWLIKPTVIDIKDDEGNIAPAEVPQLYTLKSRALLDELINFTPEVNVDRIRAMGMLMIYREEKMILYGGDPRAGEEVTPDYLGNDEFFTQNYDNKFFKS